MVPRVFVIVDVRAELPARGGGCVSVPRVRLVLLWCRAWLCGWSGRLRASILVGYQPAPARQSRPVWGSARRPLANQLQPQGHVRLFETRRGSGLVSFELFLCSSSSQRIHARARARTAVRKATGLRLFGVSVSLSLESPLGVSVALPQTSAAHARARGTPCGRR